METFFQANKRRLEPFVANTIIGGEGVNTTTAAELETLLGLSVGDVTGFQLVGNDIHANISTSYVIPTDALRDNNDITSFLDLGDLCTSVGLTAFYNSPNLTDVQFNAATTILNQAFNYTDLTGAFEFPSLTAIRSYVFAHNSNLTKVTANQVSVLSGSSGSAFRNCTSLTEVVLNNGDPVTGSVPSYIFDGCTSLTTFDFRKVTAIGTYSFRNTSSLTVDVEANRLSASGLGTGAFFDSAILSFKSLSLEKIGQSAFWGCSFTHHNLDEDCPKVTYLRAFAYRNSSLENFIGNNVWKIDGTCFYNSNLNYCEIKGCHRLGADYSGNSLFSYVDNTVGNQLFVPKILQDIDGGNPDGDLLNPYLSNWTITYDGKKENTRIAGEGANTTTASALETLLGLASGDVIYFNLNGNDIEAFIDVESYDIPANAFDGNNSLGSSITSYQDFMGKVRIINDFAFRNCYNVNTIQFDKATEIRESGLSGIRPTTVSLPSVHTIEVNALTQMTTCTSFSLPSCRNLGATGGYEGVFGVLYNNPSITAPLSAKYRDDHDTDNDLQYAEDNFGATISYDDTVNTILGGMAEDIVTAGMLEDLLGLSSGDVTFFDLVDGDVHAHISVDYTLPSNVFLSNSVITSFQDLDGKIETVLSNTFYNASNCDFVVLPAMTTCGNSSFRDMAVTHFNFPLLDDSGSGIFRNGVATKYYLPVMVDLGGSVGDNSVFQNIALGATITVPVALQTSNGGSREGDIAYAEDSRSATIIYV